MNVGFLQKTCQVSDHDDKWFSAIGAERKRNGCKLSRKTCQVSDYDDRCFGNGSGLFWSPSTKSPDPCLTPFPMRIARGRERERWTQFEITWEEKNASELMNSFL